MSIKIQLTLLISCCVLGVVTKAEYNKSLGIFIDDTEHICYEWNQYFNCMSQQQSTFNDKSLISTATQNKIESPPQKIAFLFLLYDNL